MKDKGKKNHVSAGPPLRLHCSAGWKVFEGPSRTCTCTQELIEHGGEARASTQRQRGLLKSPVLQFECRKLVLPLFDGLFHGFDAITKGRLLRVFIKELRSCVRFHQYRLLQSSNIFTCFSENNPPFLISRGRILFCFFVFLKTLLTVAVAAA